MGEKLSKLASFLKEGRLKAGLSQKEVSEYLKYDTPQFVSNWERGIAAPPISILKKLADLYKISSEKLFEVVLAEEIRLTEENLRKKFKMSKA
ncbi:helix-turn-helix domain-containing protein [Bdellovibrio svalbardensis]|uniref:Helix-turn-helix transcriptional regulator n=1 Tax=Bdellovibrio svalbardensis TaxID=2972972 RepID=A0ABT6DHU6_9BACT|nr:helix-turn-helix transcriptional regulator [Bdellovibrio svalbardensis]MDG0816419.1 helix-turn-helix transcriptional regulator [Bdellovibrio svalbardensis]